MKKTKRLIGLIVASSIFFISATHRPLPKMAIKAPSEISLAAPDLKLSARVYTTDDSKEFLHKDLIARGYIPVEVSIHNNTGKSYAISAASVPMACATAKQVAWSVSKGALPRSIGLKIASIFFWPFMIPSTIDTIHTYKNHKALVKDLTAKGLKTDDEVIPPYAAAKRVLYVKKDSMRDEFSFSLQEVGGKDLQVIPIKILS